MAAEFETTFIIAPFEESPWSEPQDLPDIESMPGYNGYSIPPYLAWHILSELRTYHEPATLVTLAEVLRYGAPYAERNRRRAVQILLDEGYLLTRDGSQYAVPLPRAVAAPREGRDRRSTAGFSKAKRQAVWDKTAGCCWYCGLQTRPASFGAAPSPEDFCLDHQTPWEEGGTHQLSNLVPACRTCNSRKGKLSLEAFRAREARRGLPHFTPEHIAYLEKLQIPLPPGFPCYPLLTFWGEQRGALI